ncbi:hypothetical protein [Bacillus phage DZ1]|uniref:Uncharacterized protein n=1 Tax=Bacillus phage DZ1 TaxID=3075862 RepID=A0AA96J2T9_9CAUD|nr:hypothetical protein [Bacillus phage DZ1]
MKGKLFNIKLTDTNVLKAEWQYEIGPEEALAEAAIKVVDYYTKKVLYIPTRSILYITEDDTKRIGF